MPTATLRAASGADIPFHPNNDPDPAVEVFKPYLILYQDGNLTPAISRTLVVTVTDVEVPLAGVTVTLWVRTQHTDPDQGGAAGTEIPVWR